MSGGEWLTPDETAREFNSMFKKAAQYAVTTFPYGLAFFTPGDNLVFNPDRTVNWAARFSGAVSFVSKQQAAAHVFP